jgi:hypothetical protein
MKMEQAKARQLDGDMFKELAFPRLVKQLKRICRQFPDMRTGQNTQYDMVDAGIGAFSVFFTQSSSFLTHQRAMQLRKGRSNAGSMFAIKQVLSDDQILTLLDPVAPGHVSPVLDDICWPGARRGSGGLS